MSANFYELLKYAATGQASPGMTYYDRMRASALMGATVQTLTGIPPLSFKADGSPITVWSMKGNGQQQGTPTPDAPIMPELVGVRTANVMPAGEKITIVSNGITFDSDGNGRYHISGTATAYATVQFKLLSPFTTPISVGSGGQGTLSFFNTQSNSRVSFAFYNGTTTVDSWAQTPIRRTNDAYNTVGNQYVDNVVIAVGSGVTVDMIISPEFTNDGVLPSGFEPYGYKIPLTCAGQTVPVYLGEVPTVRRIKKRVFDGTENWTLWNYGTYVLFYTTVADGTGAEIVSSHFGAQKSGALPIPGSAAYNGDSNKNMIFRMLDDTTITTVEGFKAWLAAQYAAGTPVTVWYVLANEQTGIVNEPLAKIGDYADELSSTDAGVTIPTARGQNTLTVDTDLQPSEMTITYRN